MPINIGDKSVGIAHAGILPRGEVMAGNARLM